MSNTTDTTKRTMEDYFNEFLLTILNSTNGALVNELKLRWKEYCNTPLVTLNTKDTGKEYKESWAGQQEKVKEEKMKELAKKIYSEQPTNDNAFVWTDAFVREAVESMTKQYTYGKWEGFEKEFEAFKQSKQSAPEPSALPTKEYEIVSYIFNDVCYSKKGAGFVSPTGDYLLKENKKDSEIHSVRRLFDNTIWTSGATNGNRTIEKFYIGWAGMEVHYTDGSGELLITQKYEPTPTEPVITDNSDVACLSLNDVMEFYVPHEFVGTYYGVFRHDKLKEKVKQKLKQ